MNWVEALRLPQESYTYTNTIPATAQHSRQGFPTPYTGTHTSPLRSTVPTGIHSEEISGRATPSRTPSRPPIPNEWNQASSQAAHMEAVPAEPRDKEWHKSRRAPRPSMLDGIPRDQMKQFWIVDWGRDRARLLDRRTRSPSCDALPDAKVRATVQDDANSGSKGKAKANRPLEDEQLLEMCRKEADRLKRYRNTIDGAYDELRAALYPDEEQSTSVRSDHGRRKCMQDAAKRIVTSTPNEICQQREAVLYARIRELESHNINPRFTSEPALHVRLQKYHQENLELRDQVADLQTCLAEKER